MGAGASRRLSAVRWPVAGNIVTAWFLTLPASGLVGALMELVTRLPAGDLIVFLLAGVIAAGAFVARRYEVRRLVPVAV
jgi:PiT family inorganic phosphate transporter